MNDLVWGLGLISVAGGTLALVACLAFAVYVALNRGGPAGGGAG